MDACRLELCRRLLGGVRATSACAERSTQALRRGAALVLFLLAFLQSSAVAIAEPAGAPRLLDVERYASEKATRVVLHLSGPVGLAKSVSAARPGSSSHLYVDLQGVVNTGTDAFEMGGLVERLRLLPIEASLRVALELSAPAQHEVHYLLSPFRVIIDVSLLAPQRPALNPTGRRVERVALDPGHGGSDSGATGPLGLREKDIVLDIAHRAAPLLARELGVSTLLTRDADLRVPLEERVARANAFGADLFVSIHCNADPSRSARGVMSFVLDGSHDHRIAGALERENAAPSGDAREVAGFLHQFRDRAGAAASTTFARLLQRATLASLALSYPDAMDGGVHGAGFYVLVGARMPAVLLETSFVSNELEEGRLGTAHYRQKLADGIVNAVRAYRAGY